MELGQVIRKYRKEKNLTQEEMAGRLGVTAPAVNKWESGATCPDVTLLSPIARLLGITVDTLLCFREEPTEEELNELLKEACKRLEADPYEEAFQWARRVLEEYPDCGALLWQMGLLLDVWRMKKMPEDSEQYDEYFSSLYRRAMENGDESVRSGAADALFQFCRRKGQYEEAEKCLEYFSVRDAGRKLKKAQLHRDAGRREEAYRAYEELLFAEYQIVYQAMHGIYSMAMEERDMETTRWMADKLTELARCFDMGKYAEAAVGLEAAMLRQDADETLRAAKCMLEQAGRSYSFTESPLYAHMRFKTVTEDFFGKLRKELRQLFRTDESFQFLKGDRRWEELLGETGPER
ncbi:MAG: helix-turn-helix transcriptional regulator [Eubacteriales bacterium]|nr:helix-turn-helix transcriptional regulator [Eubacteriales bacterium]